MPDETSSSSSSSPSSAWSIPLAIVVAGVIIAGAIVLARAPAPKGETKGAITAGTPAPTTPTSPSYVQTVTDKVIPGRLPTIGSEKAPVTLVEFADYRCPFCEKIHTSVLKNIRTEYVDTGKVRMGFQNYAFLGEASTWAAEAAECANDQGKFWQFHDYLYDHQAPESDTAYYSKENLIKYAGAVGLDTNAFATCLNSDKHKQRINDDLTAGSAVGVQATPTVFLIGPDGTTLKIDGALPYSVFKDAIEKLLQKA